ncbi:PAS domain-containing protein [Azospirillum fermentarium]|uniref:hypothetical protein n=1 Tax=Azospirillum fermentarium TaxID=1233114 RepID=UPI00222710BD|nr:hypothetical protein [Azospirillum fermentarium]MCW2246343.1 PAS domain-containing protein [Azospirillum fermentarium]
MSFPSAVSALPSHAIGLIQATEEVGGAVLVFDGADRIVWANDAQRMLMPCIGYGDGDCYETLFWAALAAGLNGNKAAGRDPHGWLAMAVATRQSSPNLNFVNEYPSGRMLVSHLRLDDGWSVQSRIGYSVSGIARFFPDYDGGVGVLWVLKMRERIRRLHTAFDDLPVAVGLVDADGGLLHRNAALDALLAAGDGLRLDGGGRVTATDGGDGVVLTQALGYVAGGLLPLLFVPLRRYRAPPLMMAVNRGDLEGTAVVAISHFGADQKELTALIRRTLDLSSGETPCDSWAAHPASGFLAGKPGVVGRDAAAAAAKRQESRH